MPARSVMDQIPPELREQLNTELLKRNFTDYAGVAQAFNEVLEAHGLELRVTKSSVYRYGQKWERKTEHLRIATGMAKALASEVGDDEGAIGDALLRFAQESIFRILVERDGDLDAKTLSALSRAASDLARASVTQKKHMATVRAKTEAVAASVEQKVRKGGLSAEAANDIRREILGIAPVQ